MASTADVQKMAISLPTSLIDFDQLFQQPKGSVCNVMGVVTDFMPPNKTRGTDYQFTFTLRDMSRYIIGFRFKFFRPEMKELPPIQNIGDVVLLRRIKLNDVPQGSGNFMGLSGRHTDFIVFSVDTIVTADFRVCYAVQGSYMPHSKSSPTDFPSLHEQQWAITLHESFLHDMFQPLPPVTTGRASTNTQHADTSVQRTSTSMQPMQYNSRSANVTSQYAGATNSPTTVNSAQARKVSDGRNLPSMQKFSLIENVELNKFYDLAGEAVKMFYNTDMYLEMYITDYTSNPILPDHEPPDMSYAGMPTQHPWRGPYGKMTLKVELHQPHAFWAHQNLNEGDLVILKNVRIKLSRTGEVEANIFPEKHDPGRINVEAMSRFHKERDSLISRKNAYWRNPAQGLKLPLQAQDAGIIKLSSKRARKKKQKEVEQIARQLNEADSDHAKPEGAENPKTCQVFGGDGENHTKLNPHVKSFWDKTPLSSYDEIVENPYRWVTTPNGTTYELPFINVKHRTHLRVVDYYPHNLQEFTQLKRKPRSSFTEWEWDFWLVVVAGNVYGEQKRPINLHVCGEDAQVLLDDFAGDLTKNSRVLVSLKDKLFILWGELAEKKQAFIDANPSINPDHLFSTQRYGIEVGNRPFEACVAEYGIPVQPGTSVGLDGDVDDPCFGWQRVYRLFATQIR